MNLEDDTLIRELTIDVERGDVDGVFVKLRPREFQIRGAQCWRACSHHGVGLDKDGRPGRRRRACLPGRNQTGQVHTPLDGPAGHRGGELQQDR